MKNGQNLSTEKDNKKKGLRYSVYFHSVMLLLILIPFLTVKTADETKYESVVEIDFSKLDSAAQQSSQKKSNSEFEKTKKSRATKVVKQPVPVPKPPTPTEVKKTPKNPIPPVVTETVEEESPIEATPTPPEPEIVEVPETKPVEVPTPKQPTPAPIPPAAPEVAEEVTGSSPDGTDDADIAIGEGDSSNGGAGESDAGTGKGTAAEGSGDGDHGSGVLSRRVVHRADVKGITQEEGRIVVDICVNNDGSVVMAKYNSDDSSIQTMDLIRKAIQTARKYRFEKDYKVPPKQCGQLTFVFEIEEEN